MVGRETHRGRYKMITKICSVCGSEKPLIEFYYRYGRPDAECKACKIKKSKQNYYDNREARLIYRKRYWREVYSKAKPGGRIEHDMPDMSRINTRY